MIPGLQEDVVVDRSSGLGESMHVDDGRSLCIELADGGIALKPLYDGSTRC